MSALKLYTVTDWNNRYPEYFEVGVVLANSEEDACELVRQASRYQATTDPEPADGDLWILNGNADLHAKEWPMERGAIVAFGGSR